MSDSDLFRNLDRSMFTFNSNNIIELCFEKTISVEGKTFERKNAKLSDDEKALLDNCIDKYMLSFNIVKQTTFEHLDKLFNAK
jgi:hypothetical protein